MNQTIDELYTKIIPLTKMDFNLPITRNKGLPGHFLEDLLGIPHTSNCLDAADGEVKLFPVKRLKNGALVPKETIAVTMLSTDDLLIHDFKSSKLFKKMSRMLIVPYYRTGESITFMKPVIIVLSEHESYSIIESDYNEIRMNFIENGILRSKNGSLLQNRTKGAGHGSTSRAFYLRPQFMKRFVPI